MIEDTLLQDLVQDAMFDLNLFCEVIDLFVYTPATYELGKLNNSPSIHYIMSSNKKDQATFETTHASFDEIVLRRAIETIQIKLQERFNNIRAAYIYFDTSQ